ncbi:MAG: hypothetical protein H7X80_08260, partial [bacterium]|nr:hypothetical protein [Candidatus Kapabacteria bacterium]
MPELNKRSLFMSRHETDDPATLQRRQRRRSSAGVRYAVLSVATVAMALMLPNSTLVDYHNEIGSIWTGDTLRAPFAFPLYKDDGVLQKEMDAAADSVLPIFVPTGVTTTTLADTLQSLAHAVAVSEERPSFMSESAWAFLQTLLVDDRDERLRSIASILAETLEGPYRAGVLDQSKRAIATDEIAIRRADVYED